MSEFVFNDPWILGVVDFFRRRKTPAWLVGGFVRDRLMEQAGHGAGTGSLAGARPGSSKPRDLDLVVAQEGIALARAVADAMKGSFFVLDRERDVARAVLRDAGGQPFYVDVARLRAPDLYDDLALRDFTVNAIAVDVVASDGFPIVDPFEGQADLELRALRAVAETAFVDDPLRMLRAVRQSVELGFYIEDATVALIRRDALLLSTVSAERVRDELVRIVDCPGAWQHVRLLSDLGLLAPALPEAAACRGVDQSPPHYLDVFDHTRAVLAHLEGIVALLWPECGYHRPVPVPGDPVELAGPERWQELAELLAPHADNLRSHLMAPIASGRTRRDWLFWAALAHDWGKPVTRSVGSDGRIHFYGHEDRGAVLAEERARALAFSADEAAYLARMVKEHMRPAHLGRDYPPTRRALYRYFRDAGDASPDCALLSLADKMATHGVVGEATGSEWQNDLGTAGMILDSYFSSPQTSDEGTGEVSQNLTRVNPDPKPLLNGHQVMAEYGLRPGPLVGRLLEDLREAQAVGEVTSVEGARAWLADRIKQDRGSGNAQS